jgi:hypothetical protein
MVDYPNLSSLGNGSDIGDIMALPNASYPWFWVVVLMGVWLIVSLSIYFKEKGMIGRSSLLSAMAIASLPCMMLATLGSLFGVFTLTTLLPVLVFGLLIIVIWIFST